MLRKFAWTRFLIEVIHRWGVVYFIYLTPQENVEFQIMLQEIADDLRD